MPSCIAPADRPQGVVKSRRRTIWIVDAHGYGKRFIVRADEKLTAFVELDCSLIGFHPPYPLLYEKISVLAGCANTGPSACGFRTRHNENWNGRCAARV